MNNKRFLVWILLPLISMCWMMPLTAQNIDNTSKAKSATFLSDYKKNLKSFSFSLSDKVAKLPPIATPIDNTARFIPNDKNLYDFFNQKPKNNFSITSNKTVDDDVIERKFFNGKETTNQKNETDFSLGTLYSNSKFVTLEFRDFQLVDGDRIKVYLNEKIINSDIRLDDVAYSIRIDLINGYNKIDIKALSSGFSGPNTAELSVFDDKGALISIQKWNIETGQYATLSVIKK